MNAKPILLCVLLALPAWGQQGDSGAKKYKWHHPWFNKDIVSETPPVWPYKVIEEKNGVVFVEVTPPEPSKPSAQPSTSEVPEKSTAPPVRTMTADEYKEYRRQHPPESLPKIPPRSRKLPITESEPWYKKGTLHKESMQTWMAADYQNRLATAGDFFTFFSRESNPKLLNVPASIFIQVVKAHAVELEKCITVAGSGKGSETLKAAETASICYLLMYNK